MKHTIILFSLIFALNILFAADMVANIDLDNKEINTKETAFGNFVADAMKKQTGSDLAVIAAQSFNQNSSIKAGDFTENDLKGMLSTPNSTIVTLKLSATEIFEMFERSVSIVPQGSSAFLQISGATITFNSKNTNNNKITKVTIGGQEVDKNGDNTYTVAMPLELGRGGNGYVRVFSADSIANMKVANSTIMTAVLGYINSLTSLNFSTNNRITSL